MPLKNDLEEADVQNSFLADLIAYERDLIFGANQENI